MAQWRRLLRRAGAILCGLVRGLLTVRLGPALAAPDGRAICDHRDNCGRYVLSGLLAVDLHELDLGRAALPIPRTVSSSATSCDTGSPDLGADTLLRLRARFLLTTCGGLRLAVLTAFSGWLGRGSQSFAR